MNVPLQAVLHVQRVGGSAVLAAAELLNRPGHISVVVFQEQTHLPRKAREYCRATFPKFSDIFHIMLQGCGGSRG